MIAALAEFKSPLLNRQAKYSEIITRFNRSTNQSRRTHKCELCSR